MSFSREGRSFPGPGRSLTHLQFFSCFTRPYFQNPNFLLPLRSLLSSRSIQAFILGNPISHEGAMSFFWRWLVLVGPFLSFDTSSLFQPFLSP
jgi:hypothetical protein